MSLGNKLLKIRKERNLTQEEMSYIIGVSQSTYCDWESDTSKPNFKNIYKICKEFDIDIEELEEENSKIIINKNNECHNFIGYAENNTINTSQNEAIHKLATELEKLINLIEKLVQK